MLTPEFLTYLEYQISKALANSPDQRKRHYWCDGILLPIQAEDYAPTRINSTRQLLTRAFMGHTGQEQYELTICFGRKAVRYYMRGNDLTACVPGSETDEWIVLDGEHNTAVVRLL